MKKRISAAVLIISLISVLLGSLQIQVFAAENIATGKKIWASSQYEREYSPEKAVDGNISTLFSASGAAEKQLQPMLEGDYHWIVLDLGGTFDISSIAVRSRRDLDQTGSRQGWILEGSIDKEFTAPVTLGFKTEIGAFKSDLEVELGEGSVYRYLRLKSRYVMCVSEFEVYGNLVETQSGYSDLDDKYYNEIYLNDYFKFVDARENNVFGVNSLVKVDEACKIALKCMGRYVEVDDGAYADWCIDSGYADSSLRGRGNEYCTVSEFVGVLLGVLGYRDLLASGVTDEVAVQNLAKRFNLNAGIEWNLGDYLSRAKALKFACNALIINDYDASYKGNGDAYYTKSDETVIERRFNLNYMKGTVTSNSVTSLYEADESGITVNGRHYTDSTGKADALIGQNIRYISDKDNTVILAVWVDISTQETIKIDAEDITETTSGYIKAETENDRTKQYNFEKTFSVLKNGVAYSNYTEETFCPQNGYLELIDTDKNGRYEVVMVWEPQIIVCDAYTLSDDKLTVIGRNGESYVNSNYKILVTETNGIKVENEDFMKSSLMYVYSSENKQYVRLSGISMQINGIVEEVDEDEIKISGKTYGITSYCMENESCMSRMHLGEDRSFLLDNSKRVVWVISDYDVMNEHMLGYVQRVVVNTDEDDLVKMRIFSRDGEFKFYSLAERVKVDGAQYDIASFIKKLNQPSYKRVIENGFVSYRLNTDGMICELDTEHRPSSDKADSIIVQIDGVTTGFHRITSSLCSGNKMVLPFYTSTPVFIIPKGDAANNDKHYKVVTSVQAFNEGATITDQCAFYGQDEDGFASFGVKYVEISQSISNIGIITKYNPDYLIVEKIEQLEFVGDEDDKYKITGYDMYTGSVRVFTTDMRANTMLDKRRLMEDHTDWLSEYGQIKESAVTGEIAGYILPTSDLVRGDIIAYDYSGSRLTAIEMIYGNGKFKNKDDFYRHGDFRNSLPVRTTNIIYFSSLEDIHVQTGVLKLNCSGGTYTYPLNVLNSVYVNKDGHIQTISVNEISQYISKGGRMAVYARYGDVRAIYIL